jgi:hypothetical protein
MLHIYRELGTIIYVHEWKEITIYMEGNIILSN